MENILISDIHLGSDVCQAEAICDLLKSIDPAETKRLLIVGDIFDSIDLRRLKKHHWRVLSLIRKLSDEVETIWLAGNHDGPAEIVSHFLGVDVYDHYVLHSGSKKYLILHGHQFDKFIVKRPILTWLADCVYRFLQKIDSTHYVARMAKHNSKAYLRCTSIVRDDACQMAVEMGCDGVVCGHTHFPEMTPVEVGNKKVVYCNTGCWTEKACSYFVIDGGEAKLKRVDL